MNEDSIEIGIVIIPDSKTRQAAQELKMKSLDSLSRVGLIHRKNYEKTYFNRPHISLYQLRIRKDNLPQLWQEVTSVAQNIPPLSFPMNPDLFYTGKNIFWSSEAAKKLAPLIEMHKLIIEKANKHRDKSEQFSQVKKASFHELTPDQKQDIEKYGIFWGLPHNVDPHITIIYNIGKDKDGVIQSCIENIKPSNFQFHAGAIAIGVLGPEGNVIRFLKYRELNLSSDLRAEGIFRPQKRPSGEGDYPSITSRL